MMFGNAQRFAIRCEVEAFGSRFGFVTLWAGGSELGDVERGVYAMTTLNFLRNTSRFDGSRTGVDCSIAAEQALQQISSGFFGSGIADEGNAHTGQDFERYIAMPYGSPTFDEWLVILLECSDYDRLIWQRASAESHVGEIHLRKGEFRRAVDDAVEWGMNANLLSAT